VGDSSESKEGPGELRDELINELLLPAMRGETFIKNTMTMNK
jgi:hypothetical protein